MAPFQRAVDVDDVKEQSAMVGREKRTERLRVCAQGGVN